MRDYRSYWILRQKAGVSDLADVGGLPEVPEQIQLPITWIDVDEQPIHFVNQMVSQFQSNEFILTFGQLAPPFVLGSEEDQREQVRSLSFVPVRPVTRVAMTADRMRQFVEVLQNNLARYDSQQESEDEGS